MTDPVWTPDKASAARHPVPPARLRPYLRAILGLTVATLKSDATRGTAAALRRTADKYIEAAAELDRCGYGDAAKQLQVYAAVAARRAHNISIGACRPEMPAWLKAIHTREA